MDEGIQADSITYFSFLFLIPVIIMLCVLFAWFRNAYTHRQLSRQILVFWHIGVYFIIKLMDVAIFAISAILFEFGCSWMLT